jgi:hypothetical protein
VVRNRGFFGGGLACANMELRVLYEMVVVVRSAWHEIGGIASSPSPLGTKKMTAIEKTASADCVLRDSITTFYAQALSIRFNKSASTSSYGLHPHIIIMHVYILQYCSSEQRLCP